MINSKELALQLAEETCDYEEMLISCLNYMSEQDVADMLKLGSYLKSTEELQYEHQDVSY